LSGKTQAANSTDPLADYEDGKFSGQAEITIRNKERVVCKDMNPEQLTRHIEFYAREIESLRIKSMEAKKMRQDIEEEQLANIPEHEREKFIQALRNGAASSKRGRKTAEKSNTSEAAASAVRLSAYERNVQNLMKRNNKTREQVEKYLND